MTIPRLFLVAPSNSAGHLLECMEAACAAGDVASLVIQPEHGAGIAKSIQKLGVAVLVNGVPGIPGNISVDGFHIEAVLETYKSVRGAAGIDRIIGAFCGTSRHLAMEMAEAGVDYVAFHQNGPSLAGVPIIGWWSELFEVPCVAFDPVGEDGLDTLLPQNPDFIRPLDLMWSSPAEASQVVASITNRLNR